LTLDQLCAKYDVKILEKKPQNSPGLSTQEHAARLEKYGFNQLSPPKKIHPFILYLHFVMGIFNVLLWVCGIVA
jgi:sodium/potassium-transporting ATPase subunit alpha